MIQVGKDADMLPSLVTRLGKRRFVTALPLLSNGDEEKARKHVYLGIVRLHCAMDTRTLSIRPNTRL